MAGENPTCTIENHPDFSEPSEIKFTSLEQLIPTLKEIGSQGVYNRRRQIEGELESIRFKQLSQKGIAYNGLYHDVNSGLRGIALQAELCGLNAQIDQLDKNTESLLARGKELARKNAQEFELYKNYALNVIYYDVMKWRIVYGGSENIPESDSFSKDFAKIYIPYLDFFGITEPELRGYIADANGLDDLYARIQAFQFSDL